MQASASNHSVGEDHTDLICRLKYHCHKWDYLRFPPATIRIAEPEMHQPRWKWMWV
jgi:hypothetical protein